MQPETATVVRSAISCTLLAIIFLQVCPLALQQLTEFGPDPQDERFWQFKVLPVCDNHEDPAGFPGDNLFLKGPMDKVSFVPEENVLSLAITTLVSDGFAPLVFRPPRSPAFHLPSPGAGPGLC